jgi:hypothetical protein
MQRLVRHWSLKSLHPPYRVVAASHGMRLRLLCVDIAAAGVSSDDLRVPRRATRCGMRVATVTTAHDDSADCDDDVAEGLALSQPGHGRVGLGKRKYGTDNGVELP